MIYCKKIGKKKFQNFFFKGGTLWCRNDRKNFLRFFKFSKFFFEKWPQWDITNVERNKVMKFELHRTVHWGVTRDIPPGGVHWTPPCRIGLNNLLVWKLKLFKLNQICKFFASAPNDFESQNKKSWPPPEIKITFYHIYKCGIQYLSLIWMETVIQTLFIITF